MFVAALYVLESYCGGCLRTLAWMRNCPALLRVSGSCLTDLEDLSFDVRILCDENRMDR